MRLWQQLRCAGDSLAQAPFLVRRTRVLAMRQARVLPMRPTRVLPMRPTRVSSVNPQELLSRSQDLTGLKRFLGSARSSRFRVHQAVPAFLTALLTALLAFLPPCPCPACIKCEGNEWLKLLGA